jgi:agmatinase
MSEFLDYRFLNASPQGAKGCPVLLGCPYDGTASYRPGARFAPLAIRQASIGLETYSHELDRDLEDRPFEDIGDLELPQGDKSKSLSSIGRAVASICDQSKIPFCLGGEHTISIPAVSEILKRHSSLKLVQLDAHLDLRQQYLGEEICHATVMRRIADLVGWKNIRQLGVRSGAREEWQLAKNHGTLETDYDEIVKWAGGSPMYLTVDLDVFDPGVMGGTGTPEPGGWYYFDFLLFIQKCHSLTWAAMDVVELSPHYDPSGASSILAAKVVRDLLLTLQTATI